MPIPLVSVIVPNYNHAPYLRQRLESIFNQTFQDFEVIILDDCSTDNSKEVIESYQNRPQVSHIIYNETNSGSTFKQWTKGISLAKGKFIWIAESDDYCEPDFLSTLMPCWGTHPDCSIVQSASYYAYPNHKEPCCNVNKTEAISYIDGISFIKQYLIKSNFFIPNASAVVFKKTIAESLPKDYMSFKAAGDRLFWIYMLERGSICHSGKHLNYYRQHDKRVSNKKETDGTQCIENHTINQYLHKRRYIKGFLAAEEYLFYRDYILHAKFDTESTRKKLLHLWFPNVGYSCFFAFLIKLLLAPHYFFNKLHRKH